MAESAQKFPSDAMKFLLGISDRLLNYILVLGLSVMKSDQKFLINYERLFSIFYLFQRCSSYFQNFSK